MILQLSLTSMTAYFSVEILLSNRKLTQSWISEKRHEPKLNTNYSATLLGQRKVSWYVGQKVCAPLAVNTTFFDVSDVTKPNSSDKQAYEPCFAWHEYFFTLQRSKQPVTKKTKTIDWFSLVFLKQTLLIFKINYITQNSHLLYPCLTHNSQVLFPCPLPNSQIFEFSISLNIASFLFHVTLKVLIFYFQFPLPLMKLFIRLVWFVFLVIVTWYFRLFYSFLQSSFFLPE